MGKGLLESHETPLSVLKKIMYIKMKAYFDHDFLEQNLFLRFIIFEPDWTFAEAFSHLFTKSELDMTAMFTRDMLKDYLLSIKI